MLKIKSYVLAAAAAALLLTSCGQSKSGRTSVEYAYEMEDALYETSMPRMASKATSADTNSINSGAVAQRKLILNGNASIEVPTISELDVKIDEWAKSYGGYVANSDWNERNFYATVKIPSNRFYDAMNSTSDFGKIKNHNINTNDVTDEYYDLESRIETKKILRDNLKGYLKKADNIKDMLEIERQLNEVESELESIEGRMKRLTNQIEFSTISLNFTLPVGKTEDGFVFPDYGEGFREFAENFFGFLRGFILSICYIVVFGTPLVGLFFLLFWLLFGKVGIIRKIFMKLKK